MTVQWREFEYCFDSVDFGIALREYRIAHDLTQKQAAEMLGYKSGAIVSKLETGQYDQYLNVKDLIKVCNWMDVSPAQFFTMQGSS